MVYEVSIYPVLCLSVNMPPVFASMVSSFELFTGPVFFGKICVLLVMLMNSCMCLVFNKLNEIS